LQRVKYGERVKAKKFAMGNLCLDMRIHTHAHGTFVNHHAKSSISVETGTRIKLKTVKVLEQHIFYPLLRLFLEIEYKEIDRRSCGRRKERKAWWEVRSERQYTAG
jgi:hypothetical protein